MKSEHFPLFHPFSIFSSWNHALRGSTFHHPASRLGQTTSIFICRHDWPWQFRDVRWSMINSWKLQLPDHQTQECQCSKIQVTSKSFGGKRRLLRLEIHWLFCHQLSNVSIRCDLISHYNQKFGRNMWEFIWIHLELAFNAFQVVSLACWGQAWHQVNGARWEVQAILTPASGPWTIINRLNNPFISIIYTLYIHLFIHLHSQYSSKQIRRRGLASVSKKGSQRSWEASQLGRMNHGSSMDLPWIFHQNPSRNGFLTGNPRNLLGILWNLRVLQNIPEPTSRHCHFHGPPFLPSPSPSLTVDGTISPGNSGSPEISQDVPRPCRAQKKTKRVVRGTEVRLLQLRFRRAGKMCVVQAQDFWLLHKNAKQMTYTVTVLQYRTVYLHAPNIPPNIQQFQM